MKSMKKLTLEFPEEVDDLLNQLAKRDGISREDVFRRALALYSYYHNEALDKQLKLSITDQKGAVLKDITFD
jgi:metal-responsive CopG/Arc/MetJ family transcriptional regulator